MKTSRKSGFTLIEIMVVISIAAILSGVTFGAFRSISDGNKRTTCQSNLSQIYKSARLYAQDYNGRFPYFNTGEITSNAPSAPVGGIGLWSLYTYPKPGAAPPCSTYGLDLSLPEASDPSLLAGYVRSPKIFHCPADSLQRNVASGAGCTTTQIRTTQLILGGSSLNPAYLSYQVRDDLTIGELPHATYSSFRGSGVKEQLHFYSTTTFPERPIEQKTVVTYCRFHRSLRSDNGNTIEARRNYDNVLFADGTVQNLPIRQNTMTFEPCQAVEANCEAGWKRVPKS